MKTIKPQIKKFFLYFSILLLLIVFNCIYVSKSARNIVFMDFWRMINGLIEPVMNGTIRPSDIWISTFGQRNVLQMLLLVFDIKYTGLNCLWESYGGILFMALSCIILWRNCYKDLFEDTDTKQGLLFVPVMLSVFNLNSWEILSLQFSMAFMMRICGFILVMISVNRVLQNENASWRNFFVCGILTAILVDFMSQLYWPGLLFTLVITWGVHLIRESFSNHKSFFKIIRGYIKKIIAYWGPTFFSVILYFYGLNVADASGGEANNLIKLLISGDLFKAVFYMLVGSLLPQSKIYSMSEGSIMFVGGLLLLIIFVAIIAFFAKGIQNITYLPMMMCAYGLISIPIITYGRANAFDLVYLTASRYTCETTFIWIGCLLCFLYIIKKTKNKKWMMMIGVITLFILHLDFVEYRIASYRGMYKDNLIAMLPELDKYSDDELGGFQAPAELVRSGTALMERYSLGFVREMHKSTGATLDTASYKKDVYPDNWVGPSGSFYVRSGDLGKLDITVYDPFFEEHSNNYCNIYVNEELKKTIYMKENENYTLDVQPNSVISVRFDSDFYFDEPNGERKLSFVLSDLKCE